ncbi:Fc.00g055500.m01.CDS01 [Cosmosporella sp. VM-42]
MVSQNEIRLLHLLPHHGNEKSPLECTLQVVALKDNPKYEAVSYVWGSSKSLIDINVSGTSTNITKNLFMLLQRLRFPNETRTLWIDQLCINQSDTQEKAQQVRLMRKIYSSCQQCLLWMGEIQEDIPQADAEQALEIIEYMAGIFRVGSGELVKLPSSLGSDESFLGPFRALEFLSIEHNPWWARVWTVQEAVLPPDQKLLWGPLSISWEIVVQSVRTWTGGMPASLWERFRAVGPLNNLSGMMAMVAWLCIAKQQTDSPVYLLQRWRMREATDPRDKVYALMGLCTSGALPAVEKCDYDMPVVDLFCDLTFDLIRSEENLFPLIMDPRLEADKATSGMPRWALDASHISNWNTDWFSLYAWPEYNAHGGRHLDLNRVIDRRNGNRHTLELNGAFIDTIETVGEVWLHPMGPQIDEDTARRDRIRDWELLTNSCVKRGIPGSSEPYPGGYTLREAFGRLMLGDLRRDGEQRPEAKVNAEDVESFYKFLYWGGRPQVWQTICGMMSNQRFFITKTGLIGLGHMDTQPGELVWAFHGGNFLFTISKRQGGSEDEYDFGGKCYVQGFMYGEAFEREEKTQTVRIY